MRFLLIALAASALAASAFAAPVAAPRSAPPPRPGVARPIRPEPVYAKVRYDSQLSVNDRCPVKHGVLNPGIPPVYVNRQPVGFC
ncbi:MAG: hypothetical protein E6K76_02995 [Candidatus Eisenbacteria bacterium]|uniref:Uncharacterized protein n=1 Tax=Eiseniibacteriota bacterium TaxID=2212470 RepID=A0A538T8Y8_UNCEI|nr:MAG: hypothetical protein E6K76_02995 [Candidatus Eisenbacteria bacterium]